MKRILLFTFVLFVHHCYSQDMWGISNSNYAGSAGMNLNPTAMLITPYCWEATLVTVNISAENNYLGLVKNKMSALREGSTDVVGDHIVQDYYNNRRKSANAHVMLQLPSFFYKTDNIALGFRAQIRTDISAHNIPADVAKLSYFGINRANLTGSSTDLKNLRIGSLSWMQYSLSVGMKLNQNIDRRWLMAASLNYLTAYEAAYVKINNGKLSLPDDSTLAIDGMSGTAAHAITTTGIPNLKCSGVSADIGVCYVVNPAKLKFSGGKPAATRRYDYRLGLTLIDAGFVSFNGDARLFNFSDASITYQNPASIKASGMEGVDSLLQASFMQGASPSTHFVMALPTALSIQYDQSLSTYFYFNISAVQRIHLPMPQVDRPNNISATLRFETPYFEVSLPYSFYDYYRHRIGFALRYHFLFAGTDNLSTFAGKRDVTGLDVYFGIKVSNFDFKKKSNRLCCKSYF